MILALAACSGGQATRSGSAAKSGADEFSVMTMNPLDMSVTGGALPVPTPGGTNLAEPDPMANAMRALGGHAATGVGIPAADAALIARVSRYGVPADIRQTLAAEDASRRKVRGFFGLFGRGEKYFRIYAAMALDAYAELARFRAAGVAVPSAPPAP